MIAKRRRNLIEHLIERDGAACTWCSEDLERQTLSTDHIKTLAAGGSNWRGNLILSCKPCNNWRGSRKPQTFARECRKMGFEVREEVLEEALRRQHDPRADRDQVSTVLQKIAKEMRGEIPAEIAEHHKVKRSLNKSPDKPAA